MFAISVVALMVANVHSKSQKLQIMFQFSQKLSLMSLLSMSRTETAHFVIC